MPGCGSSTLAKGIEGRTDSPNGHYTVRVGEAVRELAGISSEADFKDHMHEIPDPRSYDEQFYDGLPIDQVCIVDGKLATTVGPQFIDASSRPITSIDLTSQPLVSAKRITQREERVSFTEIVLDPERAEKLLATYAMVKCRALHDNAMRECVARGVDGPSVVHHRIDTSKVSKEEMLGSVFNTDYLQEVPDWELEALSRTAVDLAQSHELFSDTLHAADDVDFQHQYEGVRYKTERLRLMLDPRGIQSVRIDLKKSLIDAWSSIMMKNTPRFFRDTQGEVLIDTESQSWTPEFYKLAAAWPIMTRMLRGKTILDPFAGAGTLTNQLASRGIPEKIYVSDIAYDGGEALDDKGSVYAADLNRQMYEVMFDDLPSWYKPDHSSIESPITADVRALPMNNKSVDYIVTDPPYGKNHPGGIELLIDSLGEMCRVAKRGSIMLVPEDWLPILEREGYNVRKMTRDVSRGTSGYPTCYVFIDSNNLRK